MGFINQVKTVEDSSHLNWMGGQSFDVKDALKRLRMAAASCFFGEPMYYYKDKDDKRTKGTVGREKSDLNSSDIAYLRTILGALDPEAWRETTPAQLLETAIDEALNQDFEGTLRIAAELRNDWNIRTTPQVILVRAAHHPQGRGPKVTAPGTKCVMNKLLTYSTEIIKRADEPAVGLAYQLGRYPDQPIPNVLKKAWARALSSFNEYQLAKYRMDNHVVKTKDVVKLVWPKGKAPYKLLTDELKNTLTWEAIISKGSTRENWLTALEQMGHMAILRNIRNLLAKGVDPELFKAKLIEGAEKGKQLPFRYYSAYNAVKDSAPPSVLDAIESAMILSLKNLPTFKGRTMSLCDNSGSAQGATTSVMGTTKVSSIANLTGVLTGLVSDEGYLGIFGDRLSTFPIRKHDSILSLTEKADTLAQGIGEATENGIWLFWKRALKMEEHWDQIFIYSDMQAGHGGLYGMNPGEYPGYLFGRSRLHIDVAKLVAEYRRTVNPNVNVFLVQVAGQQDTIIPEFYNRTYILGGWGDGLLRFAAAMCGTVQGEQQC